ncbi:hypothetical protein E6O75_ATG10406 [Venturia nashicola]|uniref:Uncharacterized protein n=1 Tax=Venturia nashicola TaxID=86259 RepID=A0A4Z1NTA0_9PEZI|nr:hypothetical protein E6O75_ATG10406 [Venturia nashicola]
MPTEHTLDENQQAVLKEVITWFNETEREWVQEPKGRPMEICTSDGIEDQKRKLWPLAGQIAKVCGFTPSVHEIIRPMRNWRCRAEGSKLVVVVVRLEKRAVHIKDDEYTYFSQGEIIYCVAAPPSSLQN